MMPTSCVMVPALYMKLQREYPNGSPCDHCMYHEHGCPNLKAFTVDGMKYIPIEKDASELPKNGIWCKQCKCTSGRIVHKTFWNGRREAFAIRCSRCGGEFLMYESKVRQEYTGFVNCNGDFVSKDQYGVLTVNGERYVANSVSLRSERAPLKYSTGSDDAPSAMEIAMKKAGLIK